MSLAARVEAAIAAAGLPPAEVILDPPRRPGLGDLATPVAMALAKSTGRPPLEVARAIAMQLQGASAAPPGFINWQLPEEWLTSAPFQTLASRGPVSRSLPEDLQAARSLAMGEPAAPVRVVGTSRELPSDALWLWLQLKPAGTPLELDLDLAARETVENPAYYLPYTLGRARSIVARAAAEGLLPAYGPVAPEGRELLVTLLRWQDELRRQPQRRVRYAHEVADGFHQFYACQRVFGAPEGPSRLALVDGTARVLAVVLEEGLGVATTPNM